MKNYAGIENRLTSLYSLKNSLEHFGDRKGSRYTEQGLKWAIEFLEGINREWLTEKEVSHYIRCTTYRGNQKPIFIA